MKKSTKLIAMMTVIALMTGLLAAALADDKIFTSSVFSIPKNRVEQEMLEEAMQLQEEEPDTEPEEETEPEDPEVTEPEEETEPEDEAEEEKPAGPVERQVKIYSSRKEIVIKNDIITLSSELIGFDGVSVRYQWQVDRGDGAGWVDVEGANGPTHEFMARPDTILFNWRLSVTVDE